MKQQSRSKTMKKILYSICIFGFCINAFSAETSTEDFFIKEVMKMDLQVALKRVLKKLWKNQRECLRFTAMS